MRETATIGARGRYMAQQATHFGAQVRALRFAAGLTQAELAEASGISERTVSDLERGRRGRIYPATARRLAAALCVSGDRLTAFLLAAHGSGEPGTSAAGLLGPVPTAYRSRLPPRPTRLIGRDSELASILALLRNPHVHLVTVLGPGGVGKTRLVTEAAVISHGEFTAGLWFIDLSPIGDAALVLPSIASSIGLQPGIGELPALLANRIGGGKSLLVLDTFEHLLPAGPAIAGLAASCPGLTVLVTSRTGLNVRGEQQVPLQPLPVRTTVGHNRAPAAVELFVERAQAVAADLAGTAALDAAAEICARLDGLPLAIELAAARTRHMPVTELLDNLDHRLDLLVGGGRDLPARQQAMRTALDWSHALLDGPQMRLFRGLSVFGGGVGREAAQAVAAGAENEPALIAALSALADASLVTVQSGVSGRARYRMLDLVREYAAEHAAAAGDLEALQRRHAAYFLTLAERAEPELRGPGQQAWYARLLEDEGNFRAALTWALRAGDGETALRLAGALWMFWRWAGLFAEGRGWLTAALAAGQGCPPETRLQGLWGAGWLAYHQGDYQHTGQLGRQMLQLAGSENDRLHRRNALTLIGNAALAEGSTGDAIAALSQALGLCEGQGATWHLATSLLNLGTARMREGRTAEAEGLFTRALSIYQALGDQHFTARVLIQLGYAALTGGQPDKAAAPIRQAMQISAQLADAWSIADGLHAVANLYSHDDAQTAAYLAAAAGRLREQISMRPHPADAIINGHHLTLAQRHLGPDRFHAAAARGHQASAETAVAAALAATGAAED
jgi:predicted ATPase/transcriptional regulator with XRE-family HTH domain